MDQRKLILSNEISELEKVNFELEKLGEAWSLEPKIVFELNLVIEELITNIIFYAYEDKEEHEISVLFSKGDQSILITIYDDGKPFNPLDTQEPDDLDKPLEDRTIGGLGIHFVKTLMDQVEYTRDQEQNVLSLEKKI